MGLPGRIVEPRCMTTDVPRVVPIDVRQKKPSGLTESERQLLLDEIAEIAAELSELQRRAAQIAGRAAKSSPGRADRSA
jgi:hypothetical protein